MASIFEQYGIKEVADVTFYERDAAGHEKPVLYIDTAKVSTIEKTASTAEARGGKGNPALISWDFGLEINVTLEDALFSPKSMALMQGANEVIEGSSTTPVYVDVTGEIVTVSSSTQLTLKHAFKKNSIYIYEIDENGRWTNGQQLRGWEATTSSFSGTTNEETKYIKKGASGTAITGSQVAVFYKTPIKTDAQLIKINSDTFPGTYRVVGDTFARSRSTGKDEYFQFIIHRAKVDPANTITLSADGDPSTFNMSLKVLRNTSDSGMIDLIRYNFDENEADTSTDLGPSDTVASS